MLVGSGGFEHTFLQLAARLNESAQLDPLVRLVKKVEPVGRRHCCRVRTGLQWRHGPTTSGDTARG